MCGVSYALNDESYLSRSRSLPPFLRALSRSSSFFRDFLLGDPLRLFDRDLFLCFRLLLSETEKTQQILIQVGETCIKWRIFSRPSKIGSGKNTKYFFFILGLKYTLRTCFESKNFSSNSCPELSNQVLSFSAGQIC